MHDERWVVSPALTLSVMATLLAGCGRLHFDELADARSSDAFDCGHTFCDNFDRPGPPEATWDSVDASSIASAALVQDQVTSPPSSLLITLPVDNVTPVAHYTLLHHLPVATSTIVVDLQMAYATASTMNTEADLVSLHWTSLPAGCTDFGYNLVRDGTGPFNLQETYLGTGCGPAASNVDHYNVMLDNQPLTHVRLEITLGAQGTAHLKLDVGASAGVVDVVAANPIPASATDLGIGLFVDRNGRATWFTRYDDVLVDIDR